jgi:hypothetical protein
VVVGFYAPVVFLGSALRHLDGEPARLGRSVTVTVALRLGRTGSFSLLFFFPRNRGSGEEIGTATCHFCLFRAAETTGSETFSYGTGTVGWFGSLQCRRRRQRHRLTIWNGNRRNVVGWWHCLIQNLVAPLTQPSFASFVCSQSQTTCRRV